MKQYPIPQQALARLRAAYQQFEGVAQIIADTLEIPGEAARRIDLEHGVFVTEEEQRVPNGKVPEEVSV